MPAYYNESDRFAAAWLRALIDQRWIANGEVDTRSIELVQPADLRGFEQCHFFAGIGGWSYALRIAEWPDGRPVWTGSCPCGPFSKAGAGTSAADPRHLWPSWFRLIRECRPLTIFGEQVSTPDGLAWLDRVSSDLEGADYAVGACNLCAASVGAPINRPRLFVVAQSLGAGLERFGGDGVDGAEGPEPDRSAPAASVAGPESTRLDALPVLRGFSLHDSRRARGGLFVQADRTVEARSVWAGFELLPCNDGWRHVEPGAFPLAHGVPGRVGRLRGYGNAIVPQAAAEFIAAYCEAAGIR
jgi:DNA (cytosine-5)-methyltransferase 1